MGSAAAEGIPAIFCSCDTCRQARINGGKDMRMRTAYQLGETVRIDFGPDNVVQDMRFNIDGSKLRHLLVTHSHEDHFVPDSLFFRRKGYSKVPEGSLLRIYGNAGVARKLEMAFWDAGGMAGFRGDFSPWQLECTIIEPFKPFELKDAGMTVHPLKANHFRRSVHESPTIFLVSWEDRNVLFANDSGYYCEEDWDYLKSLPGLHLDAVFADCTHGILDNRENHMGGNMLVEVKDRMESEGLLSKNARFIVNHFSHNGLALHSNLEGFFNPKGIEVAYDGMVLEL